MRKNFYVLLTALAMILMPALNGFSRHSESFAAYMSSSDLSTDNETIYVGGKDHGANVKQEIYSALTHQVIYKAKQTVNETLSGKKGKLFILIYLQGKSDLDSYVFVRPRDSFLKEYPENSSYVRVLGEENGGLLPSSLVPNFADFFYVEKNFSSNEQDIEFTIEGLDTFENSTLVLETTIYYEDTETFESIQKVELEITDCPVCGNFKCELGEREESGECSCSQDCYSEFSCSSCPDYEIQMPSDYVYACSGECPGYMDDRDENGTLIKKKQWDLDEINNFNTISLPVYAVDSYSFDGEDSLDIPVGGYFGSIYWISSPGEVKLFKFVLPEEVRLKKPQDETWTSYQLTRWSFYMASIVTIGTGAQDFIVKYMGPHCDDLPPTIDDYYSIRKKVWASNDKNLCWNPNATCYGKLYDEDVWFEVGFHIVNPNPPLGCSGQPGSGCELGDPGQSVLLSQTEDPLPGCYYALVVNWGQGEDPTLRVQVGATWSREK